MKEVVIDKTFFKLSFSQLQKLGLKLDDLFSLGRHFSFPRTVYAKEVHSKHSSGIPEAA